MTYKAYQVCLIGWFRSLGAPSVKTMIYLYRSTGRREGVGKNGVLCSNLGFGTVSYCGGPTTASCKVGEPLADLESRRW